MAWRQLPALTLVLLGLMLAAPLSSGDKGLWLSLAPAAVLLADAPVTGLPAEHSTLAPDRQSRPTVAGRIETSGSDKSWTRRRACRTHPRRALDTPSGCASCLPAPAPRGTRRAARTTCLISGSACLDVRGRACTWRSARSAVTTRLA